MGPKKPSREVAKLGGKIRALRRRESISQAELASRLEVSASYLNLIENDRRPLPALVLFKLARVFSVDLREFVADDDARLVSELLEAFSDPLFEGSALKDADLREFVATSPAVARESLKLYRAFARSRENAEALAQRLAEAGEENAGTETLRSPSEDVNDLVQRHSNHFAELEEAAAALYPRATKPADVPAPTPAPARDDFDDFDRELAAELGEELPAAPPAAEASDAELDEEMEEVEIETTAAPPQSCAAGGAGAPSCAANAARAPKDTAAAKEETKTAASREGGAVIELSAQNLEATIKDESKHTLVMFYAPWCSVRT